MYTVVSDHPDGRPSPVVQIIAESLAKMMEGITGHKYKVVSADKKPEEPKVIDAESKEERHVS